LENLTPSTQYFYQVTSANAIGRKSSVGNLTFTTTPPLEITNLRFNPGVTTLRVTWTTNRPASSRIDYGQTPSYELGFVEDPALALSHTVSLTGLDPDTLYDFMASSVDGGGFAADSGNQQVVTKVADPCGIVSDDFDQPNLDTTHWSYIDP